VASNGVLPQKAGHCVLTAPAFKGAFLPSNQRLVDCKLSNPIWLCNQGSTHLPAPFNLVDN
jgi:hypothetical protein